MGTPDYARAILERIVQTEGMKVVAVYTQPDKPVGRKKILTPPPVKELACERHIPVFQPNKLREAEAVAEVCSMACDFIVVAAYGQILPKAILEHAPCINLHASILPSYRGASPIQQTLVNGDTKTGVTAMLMDEGLDTGAVLKIEEVVVAPDMMAGELFETLTHAAAKLTIDVLQNFASLTPTAQNEAEATLCTKITKNDGLVDFEDATAIYNRYRAFTPWPGIFLQSGLKLKKMALHAKDGTHTAGEILGITSKSIIVGCQKGSLEIFILQPPSKNEMDALAYINGKRFTLADILS